MPLPSPNSAARGRGPLDSPKQQADLQQIDEPLQAVVSELDSMRQKLLANLDNLDADITNSPTKKSFLIFK